MKQFLSGKPLMKVKNFSANPMIDNGFLFPQNQERNFLTCLIVYYGNGTCSLNFCNLVLTASEIS